MLVLIGTLVVALQKSAVKGLQQWRKESEALAARDASKSAFSSHVSVKLLSVEDLRSFLVLAAGNSRPISLIVGCWTLFLLLNVMTAPQCSPMYWAQQLAMVIMCGFFTKAGAATVMNNAKEGAEGAGAAGGAMAWTPRTLWLYPLLSTVAGFLGGFLGIGGGIIMSPLLLELGLAPEASQATSALFVLLSSSLATIQFVVLGKTMPQYVLWFSIWTVLATFAGQTIVDYLLRRYRRSSPIVLSIAAITGLSLLLMGSVGLVDVVNDLRRGADMRFHPRNLCL